MNKKKTKQIVIIVVALFMAALGAFYNTTI